MRALRDLAWTLGVLAATVGGVAVVTMGITALMIPASATAVATPTPMPSFDLAVAPTAIGGSLTVTGDRTGTLTLDEMRGGGTSFRALEDGAISIQPGSDAELRGPDGRVVFGRNDGSVTQIDFSELSFYLDPGDCSVTLGAVDDEGGLAALVECPDIADIRGNGVVSITGIVALPAEALRGRGGLPQTGGSIELASESVAVGEAEITTVSFAEAEIFLDVPPGEDGRVTAGAFTEDGGMALEYDPAAEEFFLTNVSAGDLHVFGSAPCLVAAEELGRISDTTRVVRMEFECAGWTDAEGDLFTVSGSVVVDVISGFSEVDGDAP